MSNPTRYTMYVNPHQYLVFWRVNPKIYLSQHATVCMYYQVVARSPEHAIYNNNKVYEYQPMVTQLRTNGCHVFQLPLHEFVVIDLGETT